MLQDKLESALAEAHKAQTESMTDVRWRGSVVEVRNDKVRAVENMIDAVPASFSTCKRVAVASVAGKRQRKDTPVDGRGYR